MPSRFVRPGPSPRRPRMLAFVASTSLHLGLYLAYRLAAPPLLDLTIDLDTELQFGLMDAVVVAVPSATASAAPSQAPTPADELPSMPPLPPGPDDAPGLGPPAPDAGAPEPDASPPEPDAATQKKKRPPADAAVPEPDAAVAPKSAAPDAAAPPASAAPDAGQAPPSTLAAAAPDAGTAVGAPDGGQVAASSPPRPEGLAAQPPSGAVALPAGAQIALRLDLAAVRTSPLAEETRALLAAIPDWQRLLDGAGVDPVTALDRVLIASPSLRQDRMVLAGSLSGPDTSVVERAVRALADARGVRVLWTMVDGRLVAPWANPDDVVRHVALLDLRHFVIGRLEDLPTVLALAQAREDSRTLASAPPGAITSAPGVPASAPGPSRTLAGAASTGGAGAASNGASDSASTAAGAPVPPPLSGPAVLLWMPAGTVISLEIDGARRLVRGQPTLAPDRLRVAVQTLPDERVGFEIEATYTRKDEAELAVRALESQRRKALGDPMTAVALRMMGVASTLEQLTFAVRGETQVFATAELTYPQLRAILVTIRSSLEARAARIRAAAQAVSAPPSTPGTAPATGPPTKPPPAPPPKRPP